MDARIFLYSVLGFFLGAFLFYKGFVWLRQKNMMENIPTSKIRGLAMGLVEIYGKVVAFENNILKSPFSDKDCVYYKYDIQEHRSSGKSSSWVTINSGKDMTYFYVKDKTGKVLVNPEGAEISIPIDYEFSSNPGKDPPLQIKKFLKTKSLNFEGFFGMNKKMRYYEYFIALGDMLYIFGTAADNPLVKESTAAKNESDIMIQKGKNEKFYFVSDKQEKHILSELKWKVVGGLFGGAVLMIACLTVIFKYLGFL